MGYYTRGWHAWNKGMKPTDNPHTGKAGEQWLAGWIAARDDNDARLDALDAERAAYANFGTKLLQRLLSKI